MVKNDFDVNEFITVLNHRDRAFRFAIFVCGVLIYSISFSIFYSPRNIVTGGTTGVALIFNYLFHINTSITVFILSFITLVMGYFLLGKDVMFKTIFGVIMLPVFMEFGALYVHLLHFDNTSLFLITFFGGVIMGFGNGLIIRSGYSTGGFQTMYQILYKYFGISIGKSTLLLNGILIFISSFFFGVTNALYAIIGLYISSVITDKVMLETSLSKIFYIVTDKEEEISQYIVEELGYGVTLVHAKGGYSNQNKDVLMCAVATRDYYQMKEVVQGIDPDVFFLITDTYEVYDGVTSLEKV